jgi:hypothetical protein
MPERVVALANSVSAIASDKVAGIEKINARTRLLALNALIEATRAGTAGAGFGVVAQEVKLISREIDGLTAELTKQLQPRLAELDGLGKKLVSTVRGTRLADLALNLIEIIDRNLYERSCDVRWWATDAALVSLCSEQSESAATFATRRLGIILDSYTVYSDLVVCDTDGKVLAHGRPGNFPQLTRASMAHQSWFRDAMTTEDGTQFAVADVAVVPELGGKMVATYATAIREGGDAKGKVIGVLGVYFDWGTQAQAVVDGVRITDEEKPLTRALIVDANRRIIASSDKQGVLKEIFPLVPSASGIGHYENEDGSVVGYALTPGYETYKGLGWYGVMLQRRPRSSKG